MWETTVRTLVWTSRIASPSDSIIREWTTVRGAAGNHLEAFRELKRLNGLAVASVDVVSLVAISRDSDVSSSIGLHVERWNPVDTLVLRVLTTICSAEGAASRGLEARVAESCLEVVGTEKLMNMLGNYARINYWVYSLDRGVIAATQEYELVSIELIVVLQCA